jgi:hypothetical protein
VAVVV